MLHRLQRSTFVRPRERLYELLALQQADTLEGAEGDTSTESVLDHRTLSAYLAELVQRGLLEWQDEERSRLRLTDAGRQRLHYLLVDYVRELGQLYEGARQVFHQRLVDLAMQGVERVAFYPFGETAEVAYNSLEPLGLKLVAIVDDSPAKWDVRFHGLRVRPPSVLAEVKPDAVVVTTTVFQDRIVERLRGFALPDVRIQLL